MNPVQILICACLIVVSGYLSASEIALFSLSRFQLRTIKERLRTSHRKIKRLLADPSGLLVTILVLNEIVNISLSAEITTVLARYRATETNSVLSLLPSVIPKWAIDTLLGIFVSAPIVLFFCEVTPKVIAARANQVVAPLAVGPLSVIYDLMKPIRITLTALVRRISNIINKDPPSDPILRESDFLLLAEEGHREGTIQESELELIRNVFEFDDTAVRELTVPISNTETLIESATIRNVLNMPRGYEHSRIPVLNTTRKKVVGVLYVKDLLRAKLEPVLQSQSVMSIVRKPLFVNSDTRLNAVFRKFKQQRTHLAIVQDSVGNSVGIVTMTDILEALFEDFKSTEDLPTSPRSKT